MSWLADVAIVEGASRAVAGAVARYHVTVLHPGGGRPKGLRLNFGDGRTVRLAAAHEPAPGVFDARAAHAFARAGTYAVTVRSGAGRRLAETTVIVRARPPVPGGAGAAARSSAIAAPRGRAGAADASHSGILVAPDPQGATAPAAVATPPAGAPAAAPPVPEASPLGGQVGAPAMRAAVPTAVATHVPAAATRAPAAPPVPSPAPLPVETPRLRRATAEP